MNSSCDRPERPTCLEPGIPFFSVRGGSGFVVFEYSSPGDDLESFSNEVDPNLYEFFNPVEREELFKFCKTTSEYIDENGVSAVAFLDRSARPMWIGLNEYRRRMFGDDKPMPEIFFLNPAGFERQGDIQERLETDHPYLAKHRSGKVLLLDTCIHTGISMESIAEGLNKSGFEDVRVGVVNDVRSRSDLDPDLVMQRRIPAGMCYPFGVERAVKDGGKLHSDSAIENTEQAQRAARLRLEIKRIVNEYVDGKPLRVPEPMDELFNLMAKVNNTANRRLTRISTAVGGLIGAAVGEYLNTRTHPGIFVSLGTIGVETALGSYVGNIFGKMRGRLR